MVLLGAVFLIFAVALICALAVLKGTAAIISGVVAFVSLIAIFVIAIRLQKHVIARYPIRARSMLDSHLKPDDGELVWVYGMTTLGALVNLLQIDLSRSYLVGLTRRRILLLCTTDRLTHELGFRSIAFAEIKRASVEDCSDPYGLGPLAAKPGLKLVFELQDGKQFAIGSQFEFPAFPAHKENLKQIASFFKNQEFRTSK